MKYLIFDVKYAYRALFVNLSQILLSFLRESYLSRFLTKLLFRKYVTIRSEIRSTFTTKWYLLTLIYNEFNYLKIESSFL